MFPTIVITGASLGIGRETACRFAEAGYRIAMTYYKDEKEATITADECRHRGAADVHVFRMNVVEEESVRSTADRIINVFGSVSVLVNNAAIVIPKTFSEQSWDEIRLQLRINLEGLIHITKILLPHITETILNIGSGLGMRGKANDTIYCATKFGLRGFTQALAQEHPSLRILCVNPDATKTRMHEFKRGRPPREAAEVIFHAAEGRYPVASGGDVNMWEILK